MSDTVIQIENISKLYQLGEISTGTLSRDMQRWWARFRGQEDPFKKVGQVNDRTKKSENDIVWALKDISFEVKKGEVLGIIGNNGAGKSTLLKILSRVTKPTTGRIRVKGRIASLLEVGTGFHQELTGRENIFLNGAIMGMKKAEIRAKLDEIVAFSGVERYIDTPVKRYSSGMHVRLGFAVAAHLEPEILVIDEVLAVGDAEFQKKCLGKMKDVSEKEGRTVLFVSHNMHAVQRLCHQAILLSAGTVNMVGKTQLICDAYLSQTDYAVHTKIWREEEYPEYPGVQLTKAEIVLHETAAGILSTDASFLIKIHYNITIAETIVGFTISFWNANEEIIFQTISNSDTVGHNQPLTEGHYTATCSVPAYLLNQGHFAISINIFGKDFLRPLLLKDVLNIRVEDGKNVRKDYHGTLAGYFRPDLVWTREKIGHI